MLLKAEFHTLVCFNTITLMKIINLLLQIKKVNILSLPHTIQSMSQLTEQVHVRCCHQVFLTADKPEVAQWQSYHVGQQRIHVYQCRCSQYIPHQMTVHWYRILSVNTKWTCTVSTSYCWTLFHPSFCINGSINVNNYRYKIWWLVKITENSTHHSNLIECTVCPYELVTFPFKLFDHSLFNELVYQSFPTLYMVGQTRLW